MKFKVFGLIFSFVLCLIVLTSCSGRGYNDSYYQPNYPPLENTEEYKAIEENVFKDVLTSPLSTFSIDVDTASYSNMRRFLNQGQIPPKDSIRTEELINYFTYDYPAPDNGDPIRIITEVAENPWNDQRQLAMIALQGIKIDNSELPPSHLVFLIDVSGSMDAPNKLPLVKSSLTLLVNNMREEDKISIVTYAGNSRVVLNPTSGINKNLIIEAIDNLLAGGSTNGAGGIQSAYRLAEEAFIVDGNNRVILCTDGDFNVGISSDSELQRLIEAERNKGIYLSVLGFGMGNYKDAKLETLADKGNGNYAYIDTLLEAKKVLVEQMGSTIFTIAKDVKIQVEFNPANVKAYRLIGYENRLLNDEDFNDDTKDAGELGAGFTVTAFYEIIPTSSDEVIPDVDDLKYQETQFTNTEDLFTVKLRYKEPTSTSTESLLIEHVVKAADITTTPSNNFLFASAVAEFGLLIRDSQFKSYANFNNVIARAQLSKGEDEYGYRAEFIRLVALARDLMNK